MDFYRDDIKRALHSMRSTVLFYADSQKMQVSVVVEREDVTRALRSVHGAFTLSFKSVSVAVIGSSGVIGKEFIAQLMAQEQALKVRIVLHQAC